MFLVAFGAIVTMGWLCGGLGRLTRFMGGFTVEVFEMNDHVGGQRISTELDRIVDIS